jgi:hypothetical protein
MTCRWHQHAHSEMGGDCTGDRARYRKDGVKAQDTLIIKTKVANGATFLTHIHHRQAPWRVLQAESDAAPARSTEAYFRENILHRPITTMAMAADPHSTATYIHLRRSRPRMSSPFSAVLRHDRSLENRAFSPLMEDFAR